MGNNQGLRQRSSFQFEVFKLNLLILGSLTAFAIKLSSEWLNVLLLCPTVSFCLFCFWIHQGLVIRLKGINNKWCLSRSCFWPPWLWQKCPEVLWFRKSIIIIAEIFRKSTITIAILCNFVIFPRAVMEIYYDLESTCNSALGANITETVISINLFCFWASCVFLSSGLYSNISFV